MELKLECLWLAQTEQADLGTMLPATFAIPEFNALDDAAVSGKVDGAGAAARRDAIANDEFLVLAIAVVHDHALEENLAAMERSREKYWLRYPSTSPFKLRWRAIAVRHCFHVLPGERILEIGAGSGLWTRRVMRIGS